jgi:signal peptidase I
MNDDNIQRDDQTMQPAPQPPSRSNSAFFKELFQFAILILVILVPLRLYVAQPFIVVGTSMEPTFSTDQYLIVDELSYHLGAPSRGQVVIFKFPLDTTKYFIKRIIGLPGETVSITNGVVTIYNKDNPQGFTLTEPYVTFPKDTNETTVLTANQYFVMGDNRAVSYDSTSWGPVPANLLVGRAFLRLLPLNKLSILPGNYYEPK